MAEYKGLQKEKWLNIEVSNQSMASPLHCDQCADPYLLQLKEGGLFIWTVGLMVVNPESAWDGAYFKVCGMVSAHNRSILIALAD